MLPVFLKFLTLGGLFRTLSKGFHQIYLKCCDLWGQKTEFLRALADWIEQTPQTASAWTTTFRAHTVLLNDLLRLISV